MYETVIEAERLAGDEPCAGRCLICHRAGDMFVIRTKGVEQQPELRLCPDHFGALASEIRELERARVPAPWDALIAAGWSIVGMNHYYITLKEYQSAPLRIRYLFVAMAKDGRLIKAEAPDNVDLWDELERKANIERQESLKGKPDRVPEHPSGCRGCDQGMIRRKHYFPDAGGQIWAHATKAGWSKCLRDDGAD